ncbi:MAG: DUF4832 domain-containing protein [Spirochaetes bacterium]|nr:DUF4832 domain-containing protein [Spirochaetota bacterium]
MKVLLTAILFLFPLSAAFMDGELQSTVVPVNLLDGSTAKDFSIGGGGISAAVDGGQVPNTFHITVPEKKARSWDISFMTKTTSPITKGDTLLVICYVRAAGSTDKVDASLKIQKNSDPWTSLTTVPIVAGRDWKRFVIPFTSDESYAAGDVKAAFLLATKQQELEIGNIQFADFGAKATVDEVKNAATATSPDIPLDISAFANMGFKDDTAGDGKGGWSDQGNKRDFGTFDVTKTDFGGVTMRIADPAKNAGRSIIVFKSPHINAAVDTAEVNVPAEANAKGTYLYLLHSTAWCGNEGDIVGTVSIKLKNGKIIANDVVALREVGDWVSPRNFDNGKAVYQVRTAEGTTACVFLSRFRIGATPQEVESVSFKTAAQAIWMIAGATLSSKEISMDTGNRAKKTPRLVNVPYERKTPFITEKDGMVTLTPAHTTNVIVNPGKGWVLYGNPKGQPPEVMEIGSLGYTRYEWRSIEPAEGEYNWDRIDQDIAAWSNAGKQFSFGVMNASTHSRDPWVTPKWVFDAGAKYQSYELDSVKMETAGTPGKKIIPTFDDPAFMEKLGNFIRAMGARYDGNPNIAFIDIRSYGNWGEGHMGFSAPFKLEDISVDSYIEHLKLHRNAFRKTLLQVCSGMSKYERALQWAVDNGIGLRRDGICGNSDGSDVLACAGKLPAVFEFYGNYEMMEKLGWWYGKKDKSGHGYRLDECVETGMPTFCDLSRGGKSGLNMLTKERALTENLANRLGYHFVLIEAKYPKTFTAGKPAAVSFTWENRGVAPIYIPASTAFALIAADGSVAQVCSAAGMAPSSWKPDTPITSADKILFKEVTPGTYTLAVGIRQPQDGTKPSIKIASDLKCTGGWYELGPVSVK